MSSSEMARQEAEAGLGDKGPSMVVGSTTDPGFLQGKPYDYWASQRPAVGDLQSQAKGTGARFNAGKPPVELLLWRYVAERYIACGDNNEPAAEAMYCLGLFQETHEPRYLQELLDKLYGEADFGQSDLDAADVFGYGAKKYAAWNWAKGMPWSVPVGCIGRHLLAILWGEVKDKESGLPHAGHVGCNVMMLQHYAKHYKEGNDLPPKDLFT